ncbi:MAG: ribonuclease E activity regulator RraA [Chromatiales bacterium]
MLRVGYYQFRPLFGNVRRNLKRVLGALNDVRADIVVLPELAFTGYYFANRDEALALAEDPSMSTTVATLVALCRERDFLLVTGFAERRHDKVFNSALLIGPQGLMHVYRKLHLFNTEKACFDPGDTPLAVREVRGAHVGMMVCFDWAFPEVARSLALQGADVLCHPSNLVLHYCQETMRTRCLENKVYAVTTNRYGVERRPHGELRFTGRSQIVAPGGKVLSQAPAQRASLFVMEIDLALARNKTITARNDLIADRRAEFYSSLTAASEHVLPFFSRGRRCGRGRGDARKRKYTMTSATADIYDAHEREVRVAEPLFRSYGGACCFSGPVATVKAFEDNSLVRTALEEPGNGRVLVVDGEGSLRCAMVGDQLAVLAKKNGWTGIIVHGCIRDSATIGEVDIGIKALNTNPKKSAKNGAGERGVPVSFAGVTFTPGDYVYADGDGVLLAARKLD